MRYILFGWILCIYLPAFPQNCTTEFLLKKPGTWKESSNVMPGTSTADLPKAKSVVAAINGMIKAKYSPIAVEAHVNAAYYQSEPNVPASRYVYSIIPLESFCDGNVLKTVGETATYFYVGANYFFDEIYDTAQGDRAIMEGYNVLTQMPRAKDGYYYFDEMKNAFGQQMQGKVNSWLITYDGKLPWSYVTKKEFLEKRKRNLSAEMEMAASRFKDVLKNNEIAKGYKETEYKNDAASLQRFMKMEYQPTKERYEKQLTDIDKEYKPAFNKIDALLKMPAAELDKSAIVKPDPQDGKSYLFATEDDPMAKILIKPNPSYFNKKLQKSAPQFFCVYVRGNAKDPVVANFISDIMKAVDFNALKSMLGK